MTKKTKYQKKQQKQSKSHARISGGLSRGSTRATSTGGIC